MNAPRSSGGHPPEDPDRALEPDELDAFDDGSVDDDGGVDDDGSVDPELGDRLRALLGPTDGLDRRTTRDVDSALRARSALSAAIELFGVGWWTVETLFADPSHDDRGDEDAGGAGSRSLMDPWFGADGDLEGT